MGGFVGTIVYGGEMLKEFWPLIVAGEILRIGKGTSFGLGKYEMLSGH
jgi:CRISPR/Cas system endoribonuclease Cas6 (RAMP superfamily)